MLSLVKQGLLALGVIGVLAGGWALTSHRGDAALDGGDRARATRAAFTDIAVRTLPVETAITERGFEGIGTAEALRSVVLFPGTSGHVVELAVAAGDRVAAGDLVLRLDDDDERVALDRARVEVEEAEQTLGRYERLEPTGAISASQADQARLAVARARTTVAAAELALARRSVRAPFAGVVGLPQVTIGDRVDAGTALLSLDDRSSLIVGFELPERLAGLVLPGQEVRARAASGMAVEGVIDVTDSRLDPATRSLRVRARLPNHDDRLRPGMSFAIRLAFEGETHPAVPSLALQWARDGAYVWRVRDEVAERVPVEIVQRRPDSVLVEAALESGDVIVVEGIQRLRQGMRVRDDGPPLAMRGLTR